MTMPGTYKAVVKRQTFDVSKVKGTPFLKIELDVDTGVGVEKYDFPVYLSHKAMKRAAWVLSQFGIDANDEEAMMKLYDDSSYMAGKEIMAELDEEEYNGNTFMKVVGISGGNGEGGLDRERFKDKILPAFKKIVGGDSKKKAPEKKSDELPDDSGQDFPF